jgi:hypothetical protein
MFRRIVVSILLINVSASIEIIGAGLGRTGTLSLQSALEVLGYKGYHFVDFSHAKQWADVANGVTSVDTVIDLMLEKGFTATMDNPAADIYEDIFRRFPDARVILSVRDSPEKFAKSWKTLCETIEVTERDFSLKFPSFFQWIPTFRYLKEMRCMMGTTHLGLSPCELIKHWDQHDEGWIEEQYERHNQHVIDTIPEEQLLVFNVKDGWEPLCKFLGKPVPDDQPFPHVKVNNAAGLQELRQIFIVAVYIWIPLIVAIILMCSFFCCRCRRSTKQKDKPH